MRLSSCVAGVAGLALFAVAVPAVAEPTTAVADKTFVEKAASGGLAEVKMGKLAEKQGTSAEVKGFGKRMVKDHTKANAELKALAKKKGLSVPTEIGTEEQATYDKLAKLSGAEFDNAYMEAMTKDHDEDVAEFKKESDSGSDPDLKAWAAKTLPTLQQHDEMAHKHKM